MTNFLVSLLIGAFWWGLPGGGPDSSGAQNGTKVILVNVIVHSPSEAGKCYTNLYDKGRIELDVDYDDPLTSLEDFSLEEDELMGPGCYLPEVKLIYEHYTYVISLYCTSVKKYKNTQPFVTSSTQIQNDLVITESVLSHLYYLRLKHFGMRTNTASVPNFDSPHKLPTLDDVSDDPLLGEDEDLDSDIREDAFDPDGWFDSPTPEDLGEEIEEVFDPSDDQ